MISRDRYLFVMCLLPALILLYMSSQSIDHGRQMYEFYTGIFCAAFCFIPWALYHWKIMNLPTWMFVIILLAIFFHSYGVLLMEYDNRIWYDTVTHSFSSFVVSICAILTLFTLQRYNESVHFSSKFMPVMILLVMISFGVIWEVFEYVVDQATGTHMQYAPWDTIRDMLCNSFGSLMASISIAISLRKTSINEFIDKINLHPRLIKFLAKVDEIASKM